MPKKSQQPKIPKNVASVYRICKVLCRFTRDIPAAQVENAFSMAFLAAPGDPEHPMTNCDLPLKHLEAFLDFHAAITKGRK